MNDDMPQKRGEKTADEEFFVSYTLGLGGGVMLLGPGAISDLSGLPDEAPAYVMALGAVLVLQALVVWYVAWRTR